ncbi:MAG TPA: hypothetical protein VKR52_19495 [Terracidiphilus sp.]|nr:hypothetical protein [Terracidiphilus sp.]
MELLDRYLQAVKKHLPLSRQNDIIAELRANLESQLEDKEAEAGRPLTDKEAEEWLKQLGPPLIVAARYQPQRYLIGPGLFPVCWYVMKIVFFWCLIIYAFVSLLEIAAVTPPSGTTVAAALIRAPGVLLTTFAWVTLVFVAIEYFVTRNPEKCPAFAGFAPSWSPASLPPLEKEGPKGKTGSFAQAVAEAIFAFLALIWLLLVPENPYLLLGPGAAYLKSWPYQLGHVWTTFYWWIVALTVMQLIWQCVDLARGSWREHSVVRHLVTKGFGLIPMGIVLFAPSHAYFTLKNPAAALPASVPALQSLNNGVHQVFGVIAAIVVLQFLWDAGQACVRAYRAHKAA